MKIKNWKKFQHFKDRRPPWIKLYRDIMDQKDINTISDRSFRVLVYLWLMASEDEEKQGNLPPLSDIAYRLRITENKLGEALRELTPWVEQDDIGMISDCYQDATPEGEGETEAYKEETEKKTPRAKPRAPVVARPEDVSETVWTDFLTLRKRKRAPVTATALAGIVTQADKAGYTLEKALAECSSRGWAGFKAEWVASAEAPRGQNLSGGGTPMRDRP